MTSEQKALNAISDVDSKKRAAEILTALCKLPDLPYWERNFVRQLARQKTITPRQEAELLRIRDIYLGKETSP